MCMHAALGFYLPFRGEADIFNTLWLRLHKELPAAAAHTFSSLCPWGRAVSSKQGTTGTPELGAECFTLQEQPCTAQQPQGFAFSSPPLSCLIL